MNYVRAFLALRKIFCERSVGFVCLYAIFDMKILQINCVYAKGSTGKITRDIHEGLLRRGFESVVIYGRGKKVNADGTVRICGDLLGKANNLISRITGLMYGACHISTSLLIRKIRKERPDIVHLQCINGYFCNIYRLLAFLKKSNIPTVITLHAEFMYTGNCGYADDCDQWISGCTDCPKLRQETKSLLFDRTSSSWKKMHRQYEGWENLTIVGCSDWIRARAQKSGALKDKNIITLHNGIDNESIFYPREEARERIFSDLDVGDDKVVLFVAPYFSELKGFDFALALAQACEEKPYKFVFVGEDFKTDKKNIVSLGKINDQNMLAEIYSASDALIMCSRNDNYPTVCLEATSCGTPVVGFDIGGVKETIPSGMGDVVDFARVDLMKDKLDEILKEKPKSDVVNNARREHSKETMIDRYIDIYRRILAKE